MHCIYMYALYLLVVFWYYFHINFIIGPHVEILGEVPTSLSIIDTDPTLPTIQSPACQASGRGLLPSPPPPPSPVEVLIYIKSKRVFTARNWENTVSLYLHSGGWFFEQHHLFIVSSMSKLNSLQALLFCIIIRYRSIGQYCLEDSTCATYESQDCEDGYRPPLPILNQ